MTDTDKWTLKQTASELIQLSIPGPAVPTAPVMVHRLVLLYQHHL